MTVEVPAGQFKALRLRNLPKDAVMAVGVQTNGKLLLIFVNEQDYKRLPKPEEPIFIGSVDRSLSFTVTIPAAGHYFLVFDNRRGAEAQRVKFALRAERGRPRSSNLPHRSNPRCNWSHPRRGPRRLALPRRVLRNASTSCSGPLLLHSPRPEKASRSPSCSSTLSSSRRIPALTRSARNCASRNTPRATSWPQAPLRSDSAGLAMRPTGPR